MSKCDISIDFYRPDREYKTGETIQGWVRVKVNKATRCRSLHLNVFWKTHGRGNTSRKNYFQQNLHEGPWEVGQQYEYPFEITPPISPQTYHGHYLNIDHYVSVRADIPWAFDARSEEEFMWRAGSISPEPGDDAPVLESGNGCGEILGLCFAGIFTVAAIGFSLASGVWLFLLLLFPAALIAFFSLRSKLAIRKLGDVKWGTLATCYANEPMPSMIQIGPIGNVKITRIVASIYGCESVTSGSGTDATTYTHELHRQEILVAEEPITVRGDVLELEPEIVLPKTAAHSIDLPDNKITWTVSLAIRLARWPDWVDTRQINLIGRSLESPKVENPNPAFDTHSLHELIQATQLFAKAGNNPSTIEKAVKPYADNIYTISLEVNGITETSDRLSSDQDYFRGKTVVGKLTGTDYRVSLQLPNRYNSEVDSLVRGSVWSTTGAILRWDPLQETLFLVGV